MENITNEIKNITLDILNQPLPGCKIKLYNDEKVYIFIGYTEDNKYVIITENDKQIYKNTIICSEIEKII